MMFADETTQPQRWVVFYTLDGHLRATCHQDGCGVLNRARLNQERGPEVPGHVVGQHGIVELERYQERAPTDYPAPADHSCVKESR